MTKIIKTPEPPYYAVIFTSNRNGVEEGYAEMAYAVNKLAIEKYGSFGEETSRSADGFGVSVSYWKSLEDIKRWKEDAKHQVAQKLGKEKWYEYYSVRITKVERDYSHQ